MKMRKILGAVCVFLGIACLLGAVGFVVYHRWEAENAATTTQQLLTQVRGSLPEAPATQPAMPDTAVREMSTIQVDGEACVGILTIPSLGLELPVLADWSYAKLKKAPCHYYGSCYGTDFVIAAHNYNAHFGRLSQLQPGDPVLFTDAEGVTHTYEVALLETLVKEATEEMIASGFDLSLYTCTTGGASRITVRCIKK
jgi:sortase A